MSSEEPGVVTRSDSWPVSGSWPVSKERHMEEGDFWYWIEHRTAPWAKGSAQSGAVSTDAEERSALEVARAWVPGLTEYHQLEILVWCLLLPGFVFSVVGSGLAAHRTASRTESFLAAAVPVAVGLLALSFSSDQLYMIMWDASIHWLSWLGWNYYEFTVRFFVIAPMVATATGIAMLLERCRRLVMDPRSS